MDYLRREIFVGVCSECLPWPCRYWLVFPSMSLHSDNRWPLRGAPADPRLALGAGHFLARNLPGGWSAFRGAVATRGSNHARNDSWNTATVRVRVEIGFSS